MMHAWRRTGETTQRVFRLVVLFCVLRLIVGVALLAFFDDDARAWGVQATIILGLAFVACVLVALAVRRWAPPSKTRRGERRSLS